MSEPMTDERLADLRHRCHKDNEDFYRYTWSFRVAREFIAEIDRLHAENAELKKGEFICRKCHLRKDADNESADF